MTNRRRWAALSVLIGVAAMGASHEASAHTETDVVAVPAGSTATVTLRPTHGCGESPTILVAVRAPVAGAMAEPVDGWSESSTPDGETRTVLEWSGGLLPTDETGAFPVEFVVPDAVGELMVFPAVQGCEDGNELAWISGDPATEFPAPASADPGARLRAGGDHRRRSARRTGPRSARRHHRRRQPIGTDDGRADRFGPGFRPRGHRADADRARRDRTDEHRPRRQRSGRDRAGEQRRRDRQHGHDRQCGR